MERNDFGSITMIGGGPAALLMLKNIVDSDLRPEKIYIFEKNERLGVGMPYGKMGSLREHVANVSANELPTFMVSFEDYLYQNPTDEFPDFAVDGKCNSYQVIPRLLLGNYLEFVFKLYITTARRNGIKIITKTNTVVVDITKDDSDGQYRIIDSEGKEYLTDRLILCIGHYWPKKHEDKTIGWYDSPYPPSKFQSNSDFPIAIRGTSLTAVDAVKTHARLNGSYETMSDGQLKYKLHKGSENFRIDMFSTGGFLPALRFHSEEEAYSNEWTMSLEDIYDYKSAHNGFVDLDHVFEINFKRPLMQKDTRFYERIRDLTIEEFVEDMMTIRKELDSFKLFKAEYTEAEKSIQKHQSISWKETLSAFSYSMNYPAKHFSAEDMLRLRKTLLPLISIIIASLPQSSYKEIIALYDAGIIDLVQVDKESFVEPHSAIGGIYHYRSGQDKQFQKHYQLYIDAVGQRPLEVHDLPFEGLRSQKLVSSAYLSFKDRSNAEELQEDSEVELFKDSNNNYYMKVHGLEINDHFQSLDQYGQAVKSLFIMAVPFIGGLNPDYSGLDFCDTAASRIVKAIN
ncbi:FAD/NAD(P)-binding protein [Chryseobacterium sp. FH1]|uniref:FAD/NAD(P)-binding protein n=1 Tax=Chryseobacterium sp. FH1 TaxID=1233951 RepID=UPI0004E45532|nr:FAD/NAD(P)-binding protein [Chryseobacterium sp. FH1]KFC19506.1 hypothetical protein IO90_09445 [Chryseobacterium sp. FH1]